jgi:hypothetical protein
MVFGARCNGRHNVTQQQMAAEIAQVHSLVRSAGLQGTSRSAQGWGMYGSCFSQPEVQTSIKISNEGKVFTIAEAPATIVARGTTKLVWQSDGNLVLYDGAAKLWATDTQNSGAISASIQGDGNIVVHSQYQRYSPVVAYASGSVSADLQEHTLAIMPSKNLCLFNAAHEKIWSALPQPPVPSSVPASDLVFSNLANEWIGLKFQSTDGNLILSDHGKETWQSGPAGSTGDYTLTFQSDGNLVVDGPDGYHKSVTGNKSVGGAVLTLQDDGNWVVCGAEGKALWAAR